MRRLEGSFCSLAETPATRTCDYGLGKCDKDYLFKHENKKSPWRSNSTPLGPRGLHPAGALTRTHRNLKKQNPIPMVRGRTKPRQTLRGSARTPPEARGLLSGTVEWGTLSKHQRGHLSPIKKQKQEGKPWAPHPTRSSPPGPPLRLGPRVGGLGVPTQSSPRARLPTGGLGRGHDLRVA